ncbi:MAG: hypothetical protein IBX70_14330 [Clostridia bacterium]|nr:hypothetical protein [Clostridia bacterium]
MRKFYLMIFVVLTFFIAIYFISSNDQDNINHSDYDTLLSNGINEVDMPESSIIDTFQLEDYQIVFFGSDDYFAYSFVNEKDDMWYWERNAPLFSFESESLNLDFMNLDVETPNKVTYHTIVIKRLADTVSSVEINYDNNTSDFYEFKDTFIILPPSQFDKMVVEIVLFDSNGNQIAR